MRGQAREHGALSTLQQHYPAFLKQQLRLALHADTLVLALGHVIFLDRARSIASSLFRAATVKGIRSALRLNM